MATEFCPHCRQPMALTRQGVRLTPLKARLFDCVRRRGYVGISTDDLNGILWDGKASPVTIRAHVWQLNELIAEAGLTITGDIHRGFYVMKETPRCA